MRRRSTVGLLRHLFIVVTAVAAVALALPASAQQIVNDLSAQPTGRIHFNSATPKSKWELVHRKFDKTPTPIWGTLYLPENLQGRVPAMVISHGSAGPQQKDVDRWVRLFNQMGMACLLYTSDAADERG